MSYHKSVLLQEVIDGLWVQSGKKYIDATLGAGGHTKSIIEHGGVVLGIDQDRDSLAYVRENFKSEILNLKLTIAQGNFAQIQQIAKENRFENVSGILFDLGVSSHQLDEQSRGFSFLQNAPLDMRMNQDLSVSAKELVNGLTKGELMTLFTRYGEEPFAKRIAEKIVSDRLQKPIETTTQLAQLIASVYPKGNHQPASKHGKVHPATKVFQALRIAVNDELGSLEAALAQVLGLLTTNGRVAIISFHSLEDRIVKHTFRDWEEKGFGKVITDKPIEATEEEIQENRRSRSSKLRIFEKSN